ncbi:SDR family NAD(P)-dependent oxidoreductase [Patescibacteria group bacterium]|nr:MAG: SDR family NAD(P)-dependent oxidoreductase [Patescibacteria group bacterium]
MTTAVTGGAGFIGSHCVRALLARGERVFVIDDLNNYYAPEIKKENLTPFLGNPNFTFVQADIRDRAAVGEFFAAAKPARLLHLAARAGVRPSIEDPALYYDVNVTGTSVVLEAARRAGVKSAVLASSSSVYGERSDNQPFRESDELGASSSPYGASKRLMEIIAAEWRERTGIPATCLRFFTVYGPAQRPDMAIHKFVRVMEKGEALTAYGNGESRRDYTYIADTVRGILAALDNPRDFRVYNLGSGREKSVTLKDLIALIEKTLGVRARIDWQPFQPGDVSATLADISLARAELGYDPTTTLEEGLEEFVKWYRETRLDLPREIQS